MKVVLCGPPHSGKSCLRQGLKTVLSQVPGAPYPYVITACPDGEGAWFHETATNNPELAKQLKKLNKQAFSEEFANKIAADVACCIEELVLVDVGGIIDDKNRLICGGATHAIILSGDTAAFSQWEAFCQSLGLEVIAKIESCYEATADRIDGIRDNVLYGAIHYLERGEDLSERPMIQKLARHLLALEPVKQNTALSGNQ